MSKLYGNKLKNSLIEQEKYSYFLPLFYRIDELIQENEFITIAIDGNSAAGKSSLAAMLKSVYSCNIFSMDDFFLQPCQRTPDRFNEPGGNVDYERFEEEIIKPLQSGKPFTYRTYDCKLQMLSETVDVIPGALNVVEGVYSLHPYFTDIYALKVFLSLNDAMQKRRLFERNIKLYDRFIREWIPMENKYFNVFQVAAKCDLVFSTDML